MPTTAVDEYKIICAVTGSWLLQFSKLLMKSYRYIKKSNKTLNKIPNRMLRAKECC